MKFFVVFCLMAVGGMIALAQQPAEWHPSLTEDNKAATWEDTYSFLSSIVPRPKEYEIVYGFPRRVTSSGRCSISFDSTELTERLSMSFSGVVRNWKFSLRRLTLDLNHLDPLDIAVTQKPNSQEWQIVLNSTRGTKSAQITDSLYLMHFDGKFDEGIDRFSAIEALAIPCRPLIHAKKCTNSEAANAQATLTLLTIDSAKRYARALMHAALLCGGAKAVSPF